MKRPFATYTILFSLWMLAALPAKACWFGTEFEDVRYIILNPDLMHNRAWWSYFYTSKLHYMDGYVQGNQDELLIAAEWKQRFKLSSTPEQIESYLFGSLTPEQTAQNSFVAEVQKNSRLADYFGFARECSSVIFWPDPWETINTDSVYKARGVLISEGTARLRKQVDPFWQKKYAFQVLRLAFYQNDARLFNGLYDTYFGFGREKTPMDWWATHYKSMVLEKTDIDSANFLHALVFSHSSNKMFASRQWFSSKNFEGIRRLARHDSDLADVYVMKAVINPGKTLDDLREVVRYNKKHPLLPLLLIREMNKLEDWIGTYRYSRQWSWNDDTRDLANDYYYLRAFYKFVQTLSPPAENPDAFYLISANLALMNQDVPSARTYLGSVTSTDVAIQYQKRILGLMLDVLSGDVNTPETANRVGETLFYLLENGAEQVEFRKTTYSVMKFLEQHLASKDSNHLAGLLDYISETKFCSSCRFQSVEYEIVDYFNTRSNAADVEKVVALFNKKDKTRLDEFVLQPYPNNHYFLELLGTLYLRNGQTKKANDTYAQLPQTFWDNFSNLLYLDEDPFVMDELDRLNMHPFYSKAQITDRLLSLETEAKTRPEAYLRLGTAWYNFSGFGNSWFMLEYFQVDDTDSYTYPTTNHNNGILAHSLAYFRKALATCTSPESKAEAYYGMAMVYYAQLNAQEYIRMADELEKLRNTEFYHLSVCESLRSLQEPENRAELIKNWKRE